jgi:hypothetical protein
MLEVQKFLRSGKTIDDLMCAYDIEVFYHDRHPLLGFNYGVRSPKFEPITRECRGLVLELNTWNLVGKPFYRFFNFGESEKEDSLFDWSSLTAYEKLDGTFLCASYYRPASEWIVSTRGTFGDHKVGSTGKTWRELFVEVSGLDLDGGKSGLCRDVSYCFELWTPHNRIIRDYPEWSAWLLAAFDNEDLEEMPRNWCETELLLMGNCLNHRIKLAPEYPLIKSRDDVSAFLKEREADDPTFEGLILRDSSGRRLKVKTQTYLALHAFFANGNLYLPKRLVPLWLSQDYDEVLLRFPDVKPYLDQIGEVLDQERKKLWDLWMTVKDIETQKEFAQTILPRTDLSSILFDIRKRYFGREVTWREFCDAWRQWPDLFLKKLQWEEVDA